MKRLISLTVLAATAAGGIALTGGGSAGAARSAQASTLPQVTVALNHSSINVGGALQSGAVDVVTNTTNERQGDPTFVRLNPGVTPDQARAFLSTRAASQDPNNVSRIGSIAFSAQVNSGTSQVSTTLQPGQYLAIDVNGDNPASFPHSSFTVQQASQPAALPQPQQTARAVDFAFHGPRTLHDGQLLQVENDGFVVHEITAIRAKNAKGAGQISKLLRAGKDNKAQHLAADFASLQNPVSTGTVQQFKLDLKPGSWVLACFMDTQDGREHTQLGMVREIRIKKQ